MPTALEPHPRPMSSETKSPVRPIVLSAIQPTADMHIGNYFGAVRNWVDLQDRADCVYGIVDLHAMTVAYDPEELKRNTRRMFASLIACGVDPDRSRLFVQSHIPEHTELCWILSTMAAVGDLSRMTQFKEKSGIGEGDAGTSEEFISSGLLFYPVLQAADILAYRPQLVPVGQDQKQHLELTRGIARRFNSRFGEDFFPEPEPLFTATPKIMSLADPVRKMSKSAGEKHYVGLFEDPDGIRKKVRSSVTDSGDVAPGEMSPGITNPITVALMTNACA
jgi:tryptophanyl-tRNA synthetase